MRPEHDLVLGDRYVLTRPIAVGGMGAVWEATDQLLFRTVAVKILKDELRTTPAFIVRFRAEARHAAGLSHPGIATVYDYGETSDVAYLVMELVPGQTLSELLEEQPDLPTQTKLSILIQAAQALHAAHLAGVIHRDVKPANLMVGPDGTVKVTDFGIARAIGAASLTDAGQVIGTAHYMSPEQATGDQATPASDIYSLGVIAYEMFAGRRPFEADTPLALSMAHVHATVPTLPDGVPPGVAELIRESLAKDPNSRPASAEVFAARARRQKNAGHVERTLEIPTAMAATSVQPSLAHTVATTDDQSHHLRGSLRQSRAPLVAVLALFLLAAGAVWLFASRSDTRSPAQADRLTTDSSASTALTETASTNSAATTAPESTTVPITPTTTAPPVTTAALATSAPATAVPTTVAPVVVPPTPATPPTAAAAPDPAPGARPVGEFEALAFVLNYYEQVAAGEYDASFVKLTPEFRADRNLTIESYSRYWRNTSLELDASRFTPGPGPDEGRVRFDARYTTRSGVVEETDEITVRREDDGQLVITEQRVV